MLLILVVLTSITSVDRSKFNTCEQTPFCLRNRNGVRHKYTVNESSLTINEQGNVQFVISNPQIDNDLTATISYIIGGKIRVTVRESSPNRARYESPNVLQHIETKLLRISTEQGRARIFQGTTEVGRVSFSPFTIDVVLNDKTIVSLNTRQMFMFEIQSPPPEPEGFMSRLKSYIPSFRSSPDTEEHFEDEEEEASSEDSQDEEVGDSPEEISYDKSSLTSVGVDVTFHGFSNAYGLPERGSPLVLKSTNAGEPYRMYNADVFEYDINDYAMSLYGSVPFIMAHGHHGTAAMLWLNSAETYVDLSYDKSRSIMTHWFSEMGVIDVFIMLGPSPRDVFVQYNQLTGSPEIPPLFGLGFHQSRWNYDNQDDVEEVSENFERIGIPMDFMWLDIEHTVDRKYFIWDKFKFKDPLGMIDTLASKGRKLVVIVDPHLKANSDYYAYSDAKNNGFLVKGSDGGEFTGWCWPGHSGWPDFTNPAVREWWGSLFHFDRFVDSNTNLHLWIDMNEPSVFNHPEMTLPRDSIHHDGRRHREVHNEYGFLMAMASWEGMKGRSGHTLRPFMLSRSFFAGSQRFGAYWNGDNAADWGHLRHSIPMLLSMSIAGLNFVGADVGGFFGRPDGELIVRWHQLGAWVPFFRAHAHIDSPRREPWLFSEIYTAGIRQAILMRYSFLPYWYTLFSEGLPIMTPLWVHFPKDDNTFALDQSFMIGSSVLVVPVLHPTATEVVSYLPGNELWYSADDLTSPPISSPKTITITVSLYSIPVFLRGGSIIPRRHYVRRSASLTVNDPMSITVVLDSKGTAKGEIYIDDYITYNYTVNDMFTQATLSFANNVLISNTRGNYNPTILIDRVYFHGLGSKPRVAEISHENGTVVTISLISMGGVGSAMLRMPNVGVSENWSISLK